VTSFVLLLRAEDALAGKTTSADVITPLYDDAITAMAESKLTHLEALANERAGFLHVERGTLASARRYFLIALHLYKHKWGSTAKFEWLRERVQHLFTNMGDTDRGPQVGEVIEVKHEREEP